MGFFGTLLSSDSVVDKAVDGVYNGLDKTFYTDEEKAEMAIKRSELHIKFLKAYEPFKIAQRFLALIVGIPYMTFIAISAVMYLVGMGLPPELVNGAYEYSKYGTYLMESSLKFMTVLNNVIGGYFGLIMGFYFAGGMLEGGIRAFVDKK